MGITAVFDGYVASNPKLEDGDYGRYIEVTLKVSIVGKEVHYVTARFYGKKIKPVQDYVRNGDYMTMSGCVSSIRQSAKQDGTKYCQIYLKDSFFTTPPKIASTPSFNPRLPSGYTVDEDEEFDDNGASF